MPKTSVFDTMLQFANVFSYFKITALGYKDSTIFIKDRVARMNNIRSRATEIVNHDIIYHETKTATERNKSPCRRVFYAS